MEHGFLDKYAEINSPIQRIEPRIKTLAFILSVFITAYLGKGKELSVLILFLESFILILISKLPLKLYLKRLMLVMPPIIVFSAVYGFENGSFSYYSFSFYTLKAAACFNFIFLLVATTRFESLLKALRFFKTPLIIVSILSFLYRYVFVIQDELERMLRAKDARFSTSDKKINLRLNFNLIGMLFLRSLERSERIYRSMLARGFEVEKVYPPEKGVFKLHDIIAGILIIALSFAAVVVS